MFSTLFVILVALLSVANAHFQLQFPPPRGTFVENQEPNFCDGYTSTGNRTEFPLSGGFYSLNSEHPRWTVAVLLSPAANPTAFGNFSQATPFAQLTGEGVFCLPLDFSTSNVTGLTAGQNVTIQIEFSGGDGSLFQCADLTLSSSASLSGQSCTNATTQTGGTTSGAPAPTATNAAKGYASISHAGFLLAGAVALLGVLS